MIAFPKLCTVNSITLWTQYVAKISVTLPKCIMINATLGNLLYKQPFLFLTHKIRRAVSNKC